jgi:hypothetical protein
MIPARYSLTASLLLPLAVFAAVWGHTRWQAQQGEEWLIPIRGYDPRDLLRGHYVQYAYDWPGGQVEGSDTSLSYAASLCIEGRAPDIVKVRAYPLVGCTIIVRATAGSRREVQGLETGILYVSQPRAIALSKQLADPKLRGFVRVRIRPDGVMRPIDLAFKRR